MSLITINLHNVLKHAICTQLTCDQYDMVMVCIALLLRQRIDADNCTDLKPLCTLPMFDLLYCTVQIIYKYKLSRICGKNAYIDKIINVSK